MQLLHLDNLESIILNAARCSNADHAAVPANQMDSQGIDLPFSGRPGGTRFDVRKAPLRDSRQTQRTADPEFLPSAFIIHRSAFPPAATTGKSSDPFDVINPCTAPTTEYRSYPSCGIGYVAPTSDTAMLIASSTPAVAHVAG
jgi:hypothetical protein